MFQSRGDHAIDDPLDFSTSRDTCLSHAKNSDSEEICYSDYSISSTYTRHADAMPRLQKFPSFVYETSESLHRGQTANERHPWLTKPVGLNSLWRDDPAGTRTPDSAGTSSDCEVSLLLHEDRRIWTKHPTTSATTPGAPMLLSLPAIAKTGVPSKANCTIRTALSL